MHKENYTQYLYIQPVYLNRK